MVKIFSVKEHNILAMLDMCEKFKYNGKNYEIKILGKPSSSSGEPKTDIYIYAESDEDSVEFKISYKQQNYEFLENKISAERAEEIFGEDWSRIIESSLNNIKDKFYNKKLIFKSQKGRTQAGSFTLGWKFELLNVPSGELSGEILLTDEQLYDVYAGTSLSLDKKDAIVDGRRIEDSGVANFILIEDEYEYENVEDMLSRIVSIDDFIREHKKMYFACKALNYRSFEKKHDGNRPLSVFVEWSIMDNKLVGNLRFDEPLIHRGNEIKNELLDCLYELGIEDTDDVDDDNTWSDIVNE